MKSVTILTLLFFASFLKDCSSRSKGNWQDSGPDSSKWEVLAHNDSDGKIYQGQNACSGAPGIIVEKFNGLGSLEIQYKTNIEVDGACLYELAIFQQLITRVFGSSLFFSIQELDCDGGEVGQPRYSPWYAFIPNFMPNEGWERNFMRWTTHENAASVSVSLCIEGNPMSIAFDDLELIRNPPSNDSPGLNDSNEQPYDKIQALKNLSRRKAEPARVELVDGYRCLVIGDRPATIIQHTSGGQARHGGFGKAGFHIQAIEANLSESMEDTTITEFPELKEQILKAVCADPEVSLIIQLSCDPSSAWLESHPDDVWTADDGQKWVSWHGHPSRLGIARKGMGERYEASYGSPAYRRDMGETLARLGRYIAAIDEGKIVIGYLLFGGNDGQWYDNSQVFGSANYDKHGEVIEEMPVQLDHSPGHQEGFRIWLRERYKNDVNALQDSWNDPEVTFESASVCSESERIPEGLFLTRENMRVIESNHFAHVAPGWLLKHFTAKLKESSGRPMVCMRYHPDISEGYRLNTWDLGATYAGPDKVDIALEAQQYGPWRKLGSTGGMVTSWGSHHLMGSMIMADIDNRSYRSAMSGFFDQFGLPTPMTVEGVRAQMRRDIGSAATRGMGLSIFDIQAGTWDDPELWDVLNESRCIMEWAAQKESPASKGEMAVFVDPEAGKRIHPGYHHLIHGIGTQRFTLNQSGVSYDMYFLDDITNPDFPDYQMYLFLGSFTLNRDHVKAIEEKCRKKGKVIVFPANMGFGSLDYENPAALAERLTGIKCTRIQAGKPAACGPVEDNDLAGGINGSFLHEGFTDGYSLSPEDSSAEIFGRYFYDGSASHAIKESPYGTAVIVTGFSYKGEYIPDPISASLPPVLINKLARKAGITNIASPGHVFYYGSGIAVCHRIQPGPAVLEFGEKVDLLSADGYTILQRSVSRWEADCELLDTDLVFYRPAL